MKNTILQHWNITNWNNKFFAFALLLFLLFPTFQLLSQNHTVSGIITDINGEPLIGVSIVESSIQPNGTISNVQGAYSIQVKSKNNSLTFSFVGFKNKTIQINGRAKIDVVLEEDVRQLEDVIVIGYGTTSKKDLTGSVAQVNVKDVTLAPVMSLDQALAGRVAGLQVSQSDGQPGVATNIVIRGANSLTQSNSPLYVIDGIAEENPNLAALNPEEIETINVLKDATATSIYGSRAANGIIIIETKKGVKEKPTITFNTSLGLQQVTKTMPMFSPYDFVKLQFEINEEYALKMYTPADLPPTHPDYNPKGRTMEDYKTIEGVNWQDQLFRTAPIQIHNISLRGRSNNTQYSLSGSINNQEGIITNTGAKTYQGRISLDQRVNSKLKVGLSANYSENTRNGQPVNTGGGGGFSSYLLFRTWAYRPVTGNPDINLMDIPVDPENSNVADIRLNPAVTTKNENYVMKNSYLSASVYVNYSILPNLNFRSLGGIRRQKVRRDIFYNSLTPQGSPYNYYNNRGVNGSFEYMEFNGLSNENTLNYQQLFKKKHNIKVVVGHTISNDNNDSFGFYTQDIPNEELGKYGLDEGTPYQTRANGSESNLLSFFTRFDYGYKSKYIFTASYRADASSKFSPKYRWGHFPSASFAWNISEENFMKQLLIVNNLKLRSSYGVTGNNRIDSYDYLTQMQLPLKNAYSFNNGTPVLGLVLNKIGNPDLRWESTAQTNLGLDVGLFNNRIEITVEAYQKVTKDLLLFADVPSTIGVLRAYKNIGSIQNRGLEFTMNTINIKKRDFQWNSSFNISFNQNKVLALTRNQDYIFSNMYIIQNTAPLYISQIGQPAGMFYGYIFDGIYQIEDFDEIADKVYQLKADLPDNGNQRSMIQPGHIKYKNLNGDGTINSFDMTIIGRGQPIHTGGFSNIFSYKGFALNVFFQWSYGNQIYNANRMMLDGNTLGIVGVNQYTTYLDRWTPENRSNKYFTVKGHGPEGYQSTRVLEDGSYLRLKTLSFSYSFPRKILKKILMEELTLRLTAQNLLTFTKYSGMDPEVSVRHSVLTPGYDYSPYPQARTITFGLNVTF